MEKNVVLNIRERLTITVLLPVEEDAIIMKRVRNLKDQIGVTEEEARDYKPVITQLGNLEFHGPKAKNAEDYKKDYKISESMNDILIKKLKKLNEDKKLKDEHLSIYEIFVEPIPD